MHRPSGENRNPLWLPAGPVSVRWEEGGKMAEMNPVGHAWEAGLSPEAPGSHRRGGTGVDGHFRELLTAECRGIGVDKRGGRADSGPCGFLRTQGV